MFICTVLLHLSSLLFGCVPVRSAAAAVWGSVVRAVTVCLSARSIGCAFGPHTMTLAGTNNLPLVGCTSAWVWYGGGLTPSRPLAWALTLRLLWCRSAESSCSIALARRQLVDGQCVLVVAGCVLHPVTACVCCNHHDASLKVFGNYKRLHPPALLAP